MTLIGAGGPMKGENKTCVFPFNIGAKTSFSCITDIWDPLHNGKPWCATAVDHNAQIVLDDWGYCNKACEQNLISNRVEQERPSRGRSGKKKNPKGKFQLIGEGMQIILIDHT